MIVLSLSAVGLMAEGLDELPSYIVLNDGIGATYYCTLMSMTVNGVNIYSVTTSPVGRGLMFVDLPNEAFHIVIFNQDTWLAYCQVGTIDKPCATAYNANEYGGMIEVTICLGASTVDGRETNPNLKK